MDLSLPSFHDENCPEAAHVLDLLDIHYHTGKIGPVTLREGELWYIEAVDPVGMSINWDPKPTVRAHLKEIGKVPTLHSYGAPVLFKPSVAEVFACLIRDPDIRFPGNIRAFRTECSGENLDDWGAFEREAMRKGFHLATTTLYAEVDR